VRNRISRRDVVECCEQLFSSRISTGTVDAILDRTAQALAEPHADLLGALRGSSAVNMDETGWRTAGERRALWGSLDRRHAYLQIAPDRHENHAKKLLADTNAIVTSDRWWAYAHLPLTRRQLCLGASEARFAVHAEGLAAEKEFGEHGLALCERVFWAWEVFQNTTDRRDLKLAIRRLQCEFQALNTYKKRRSCGVFLCARVDSNHHGP
jgi:Transposase IS66 family